MIQLLHGDCLEKLKELEDASVDSIVTDPPYELGFMGKGWDKTGIANNVDVWRECLRVLKPGGHLLAFSGSRTYHRMVCAIEDSGFEIRDQIMWVYGSGFPKSLDVSKAIDKAAGVDRDVLGIDQTRFARLKNQIGGSISTGEQWEHGCRDVTITAPSTDAAKQWTGWGTALKPAHEPICVARKPFKGTVAENVLQHGTGAINIDGCRVGVDDGTRNRSPAKPSGITYAQDAWTNNPENRKPFDAQGLGRFPANLIHDGSDEVIALFPANSGAAAPVHKRNGDKFRNSYGAFAGNIDEQGSTFHGDKGSAARFFYCAKASKKDREEGVDGFQSIHRVNGNKWTDQDYRVSNGERPQSAESGPRKNYHPTVKPTELMRYLCRLVTPPGGLVLDPFMGSGSTGKAAMLEGFRFIGIELNSDYLEIAKARIDHAKTKMEAA